MLPFSSIGMVVGISLSNKKNFFVRAVVEY